MYFILVSFAIPPFLMQTVIDWFVTVALVVIVKLDLES